MSLKTSPPGHFMIPTAPAAGTSCTSGSANVFTTTYVQLISSTVAALFITGIYVESSAALAATYIAVQLATGGAGSEVIIGQYNVALETASTVALTYRPIFPPIPVANATRIAVKTADSVGAKATLITLECIAQSNVVDGGVAETVNVTQWNGANVSAPATAGVPDVNVKNIVNVAAALDANNFLKVDAEDWKGAAAPAMTGDAFARLGAPAGASVSADVAAVKTDTAAVKTQTDKMAFTVANQIDSNVIDWKGSAAPAMTGDAFARIGSAGAGLTALGDTRIAHLDADVSTRSTYAGGAVASVTGNVGGNVVGSVGSVTAVVTVGTNNDKTGYSLSAAAIQAIWDFLTSALTAVGSIGKLLVTNIDATTSSRLASSSYTAPDNADIAAIAAKLPAGNIADESLIINATGSILTDTGAIKAKTNNLPASPAATSDIPTASIAAIKAKTDNLTFTSAGEVDANIHSVNNVAVAGGGTAGNEWGPV